MQQKFNLALNLYQNKEYKKSYKIFYVLYQQHSSNYPIVFNLALSLFGLKRYKKAIKYFKYSLKISDNVDILINIADSYFNFHKYKKAIKYYKKFLKYKKNSIVYTNLSLSYRRIGKYKKALFYNTKALELDSNSALIHWNRSHILLLQKKYIKGFKEYEYRFKLEVSNIKQIIANYNIPLYKNEDLRNKKLLIHPEHGFGDNFFAFRYITILNDMGVKVYAITLPSQTRILKTIDTLTIIDSSNIELLKKIDYFTSSMSLPYICKTTYKTIPNSIPYIYPKVKKMDFIEKNTKFKIAVSWQSAKDSQDIINRSISIKQFQKLFKLKNIQFYSVQIGEDVSKLKKKYSNFIDCSDYINDFYDTASILKQVDLVITIDSAVANLAGALGINTWVLLLKYPDWKWLAYKNKYSLWYPTIKLFKQNKVDNWDSVLNKIIKKISKF